MRAPVNPADFTDGAWHHVAATYNGAVKVLYKDGVVIGVAFATGFAGSVRGADAYIGSLNGTSEFLNGAVDQVAVHSRALSGAEIAAMVAGTGITGDGVGDACDCAPGDAAQWYAPANAIGDLRLSGGGSTALSWHPPPDAGARAIWYDVIRASGAASFSSGTCLASDLTTPGASDPQSGSYFYAIRVENGCGGKIGADSSGTPIPAPACP